MRGRFHVNLNAVIRKETTTAKIMKVHC